jgi:hypothetical protein
MLTATVLHIFQRRVFSEVFSVQAYVWTYRFHHNSNAFFSPFIIYYTDIVEDIFPFKRQQP